MASDLLRELTYSATLLPRTTFAATTTGASIKLPAPSAKIIFVYRIFGAPVGAGTGSLVIEAGIGDVPTYWEEVGRSAVINSGTGVSRIYFPIMAFELTPAVSVITGAIGAGAIRPLPLGTYRGKVEITPTLSIDCSLQAVVL